MCPREFHCNTLPFILQIVWATGNVQRRLVLEDRTKKTCAFSLLSKCLGLKSNQNVLEMRSLSIDLPAQYGLLGLKFNGN